MRQNKISRAILNASSNLVGFCFVILTSIRLLKVSERTYIDEIVTVALIFFMVCTMLSFLVIRNSIKPGARLERFAEYFFSGGLFILFLTAILILFNVVS